MKKLFRLFLILFLGLVPMLSMAQLTFKGELRPRTEYRHGLKSLFNSTDEAALFTSQRTRLNLNYNDSKFRVGLSLQDVRVWGDVAQLNMSDKNQLMLHEAWGEIIFNESLSLKVGRQELVYDDSRILGNVGWAQQARSHDLALLKFKTDENGQFHFGLAVNNDSEALKKTLYTTNYKNMQFAWYHRKADKFDFSLLFMNVGVQVDVNAGVGVADLESRYNQTFGTILNYRPGKLSLTGSLYAQTGEHASGKDVSAHMFNLGMNFPIGAGWKGNAGVEVLSGTDSNAGANSDYESFTPLFGTNHKFNGHMDYFYVGNHVGSVGLQDIYGGINYGKDKFSFATAIHLFSTQADLYSGADKQDKYLGTEVDLSVGYKYSENVLFKAGYSHMFAADSMQVLKGGDKDETQNWGWVMLVFTPDFLKR
ncbi:alginate export family protein [Labilibaculum sp.]|uniref:alginate export family protein n=1 Tax=Labilibaculum sp. TaxID=2060723 RepID=UPI002AA95256|nr:alginate export family protein [Labilibaculum sp.]